MPQHEHGHTCHHQELGQSFPELQERPAASAEKLEPSISRHAYDGLMVTALKERNNDRLNEDRKALGVSAVASWLSPTVGLALALERLAGVGPGAASDYRDYLVTAVHERGRWLLEKAWDQNPLDQEDFEALIASAPPAFSSPSSEWPMPVLALTAWLVVVWLSVLLLLRRSIEWSL